MEKSKYIICGPRVDQNVNGVEQAIHIALSYKGDKPFISGEHVVCVPETNLVATAKEIYETLLQSKTTIKYLIHDSATSSYAEQILSDIDQVLAKARGEGV